MQGSTIPIWQGGIVSSWGVYSYTEIPKGKPPPLIDLDLLSLGIWLPSQTKKLASSTLNFFSHTKQRVFHIYLGVVKSHLLDHYCPMKRQIKGSCS